MSKLISDTYKKLNHDLHKSDASYGMGGQKLAGHAGHLAKKYEAKSVLDYGCGKGTMKPELKKLCPGLEIREYDPAIPGKAGSPKPADIVICGDVMEHIEPELLDEVLAHIASLTRKMAFLAISCKPAAKILSDGRNAHLIVQRPEWWLEKISAHMQIDRHKLFDNGVTVWAVPHPALSRK